jgi:exodeoxyribonuclease VII small subunit
MTKEDKVDDLTYEEAFSQLEALVAALEAGSHPLDESMNMYERGQALATRCAQLLESAELRVKQLAGEAEVDFKEDQ